MRLRLRGPQVRSSTPRDIRGRSSLRCGRVPSRPLTHLAPSLPPAMTGYMRDHRLIWSGLKIHNAQDVMTSCHEPPGGWIAMNLRQLRAVQAVAELASVTAAANRLGLTQSGVSRMIGALEAELGVPLFDRARRRLVPTEHALALVRRAERIVHDIHELEASARSVRQGRVDRIRLISVPPFLHSVVPAAVTRRLAANPRLSVRVD